ncbi:hypothetical protein B296_00048148 [Ensete ventricosum]|uniref:trehalose-phosphatase n=1 Tax=Ensete ventricosum TaxID=4639 RepID=A0A426XFB2_ENSVE|nr:hypothetical protein B296_00048148 [Ensete ventricosum]
MTKQNVVPAEVVAAIAVASSYPLFPYPPPRARGRKKYLSRLELSGGRISAWVDSMKASSPTHDKGDVALSAAPPSVEACLDEQSAWVMRYPSALSKFEHIVSASKGKQIVMFLDYDGTLSPIVDDPDSAFMSDAMRAAVRDVARCFPTAIVSGRCLDKVINFVRLANLYYAGSHGMDIKGPEKPRRTKARRTKSTAGVKVEDNKFCVSVHFRCVDEKLVVRAGEVRAEGVPRTVAHARKKGEIQWPPIIHIPPSAPKHDCDILCLVPGTVGARDSSHHQLGQGEGIRVPVGITRFPKETNASYSLKEPSEASVHGPSLSNLFRNQGPL